MKRQYPFLLIVLLPSLLGLTSSVASTKVVTFQREYTYQASELDSKISCRTIAGQQVKRLLLEELGIYLGSRTELKNFQITSDQVTTLSAGIVQMEIIDEKWDGKEYWLKASIRVAPDEVVKSIDSLRRNREQVLQLERTRKIGEQALEEIAELRKELGLQKTGEIDKRKRAQYSRTVGKLSVADWFEKAIAFMNSGNYLKAKDAFRQASKLNPINAEDYMIRGLAYVILGDFSLAIIDCDKAIELRPNHPGPYFSRGVVYYRAGEYQKAITDFNRAMELDPTFSARALSFRALSYEFLGNYQQALKDSKRATELGP